jgi:hypothetical protein
MLDLRKSSQPYDIPLPYGLNVTVRPLATAGMAAAQAAAGVRSRRSNDRRANAPKLGCRWLTSRPRGSAMASTRLS